MANLNTQIKVGADSSGVATGLEPGKRALKDFGASADGAGKSLAGMGNGTAASAQKVESATKSMIQSIQRTTAATEAGDKSTRAYQESLARMRGIDVAALKPYLDQLDAAKSKASNAAIANESFAASFTGIRNAALIASAAIGSFAVAFKKINDGVDALNDLKDATGASIENISALEDVALRSGASFDTVSTSLIKFNGILKDAKPGSEAEQALKALGLSVADFKRLDPAEALRQTAVAMNSFADDGNKARIAQELFGKSLKDVAPFLKDLAEQGKLNAKVTTEQADQAEKFNKELFAMQKNITDVARDLSGPMVESINEVIKKFKEGREAGKGFFSVGWQNYKDGIGEFYGMKKSENGASGSWDNGATGSWGDAVKPSLGPLPDMAAAKAAASEAKKALAEQNKELSEQAKLLAELSGLTGSFSDDWNRLSTIYKSGKLSLEGLTKAQADLLAKQPFMKTKADAEVKASKIIQDEYAQEVAAIGELSAAQVANDAARSNGIQAVTTYADSIKEQNEYSQLELSLMGSSATAREIALGQYKVELDLKKQIEAIDSNAGFDEAQRITQRARARAAAAQSMAGVETKVYTDEWKKTSDGIQNTLTDALMRGFESGKDFARNLRDTVVNMFKTLVLRPIISAVMNPIAGAITGGLGLSGAAQAASGGGVMDAMNSASSFASMLNGGVSNAISSGFAKLASSGVGQSLGLSNSASIAGNNPSAFIPQGGQLTAFGQQASTYATAIGGTMAGYAMGSMARSMISGGYSMGNGMDTWQKVGIAAASAIGGPVLGAVAGAVSGVVNRAFGRKLKDSGLEGSFGGQEGFSGNNYKFMEGGWFRSDKTTTSTLDSGVQRDLANQFKGLQVSSAIMAQTLGLSAESVAGFTANIKLSFKDLTEDQINEKLALEFGKVSDSLAQGILGSYKETVATVIDQIATSDGGGEGGNWTYSTAERQVKTSTYTPSEFAREGETASQTLTRLSTSITLVNGTSEMLGNSLFDVGLKGANTASLLVDAFGGAEAYAASMGSYYQNFYRESERTANLTATTAAAFTALGKTMPVLDESARAVYRALVDEAAARDMTVESNRAAYASLIALQGPMNELAPAFATVAESAPAASTAVSDLAAAMQKVTDDLQSQGASLQAQWDKLALSESDYRAKQIAGMTDLQVAQYDTNVALQKSIDAFASTATAAADAAASIAALASENAMWSNKLDVLTGAKTQSQVTREGELASATDESTRAIMRQVYAQEDMASAAEAATAAHAAALSSATSTLSEAIAAQKSALTLAYNASADGINSALSTVGESVSSLLNLSVKLKSTLDGMSIAGSDEAYRASAQAEIKAALAIARASGVLPLDGQLDTALSTVSKPSEALYGSFEAYARDFYATANDIAALGELTDEQLTAEQLTQSILKSQLAALKSGFDASTQALDDVLNSSNDINTSVLSVADAIANLAGVMSGGVGAASGVGGGATSGMSNANVASVGPNSTRLYSPGADTTWWRIGDIGYDGVANAYNAYGPASQSAGIYTSAELEKINHWANDTINTYARSKNLPTFAQGINRVPYDMQAVIHEDEAIVPATFNPFNPNAQQSGGDTAAALRLLADRLDKIEANTRATAGHTAGTDRKLARVIPGNALITEAA